MQSHRQRLFEFRQRVADTCAAAGRPPDSVRIVAVSKKKPAEMIAGLNSAGQRDFGENYYSEAAEKMRRLTAEGIVWHFIGSVQSRAAKPIAEAFDWVHSVERLKVAERLDRGREGAESPLNVCIQVNTSREESKSGVCPEDALELARNLEAFGNLRLRGLMSLPQPSANPLEQRKSFRALAELRKQIISEGVKMDTLSMGMSADFQSAISEGATIIRVGTLLFGPREE